MNRLQQLEAEAFQSPWIDNLQRSYITKGDLQRLVDTGIRGVTSNPTIFQKAIDGSSDYDEGFRVALTNHDVEGAYWELVIEDVINACEVLAPVYKSSAGADGFVSLEVSPAVAHDTQATIEMARAFHERINLPNLMVKVPATKACVPAIQQLISEGHNINVTLIFSLERYGEVIDAYINGLEAYDGDYTNVSSVASFFVSRVDTEVDNRLQAIGSDDATSLQGQAAVAQAKLAYQLFEEKFSTGRWERMVDRGARVQRPLWASTSTKNPAYPDLLYVDTLIGPHTVNTMPESTVDAFLDHGIVARTIDVNVEDARSIWKALQEVGVDMGDVSRVLEEQGVGAFQKSFDDLLSSLAKKAEQLGANS